MIGSLKNQTEQDRDAAIVGAGISGLLTAYVLDQKGYRVTLYEESNRAGGLISSTHTEYGLVESAAHSFLVTDEVRAICQDLGVELSPVRPESRARYIYRRGKMRKFPLSFYEALVAFVRAYAVLSREDISRGSATLEQWGNRHLGKAAVRYLLSPFLTGVYAARPSEICVGAAFPALEIPRGHSLLSAQLRKLRLRLFGPKENQLKQSQRKQMMTPTNGMGSLISALEKRLEARLGDRFQKGKKLESLPEAANVILAVPAHRAAALLASKDQKLSKALGEIQYAPLVTATIFVPRKAFKTAPQGVGVLIPESEKRNCLGVLFNSSAFPGRVRDEQSWVSLTMMLGGTIYPEMVEKSETELLALIRAELRALFKVSDSDAQSVKIHVRKWKQAIPCYNDKILDAWNAARSGWCSTPGNLLVGNYTGQVSIRGMMQEAYALSPKLAARLHLQ
ncbi:MAG: protoporphyrinogen oxidase [Bdellovibrionia bacterium]